jgi:hypothetical protein
VSRKAAQPASIAALRPDLILSAKVRPDDLCDRLSHRADR